LSVVGVGEVVPGQDLPFQGGEERLRGRVVETRPDLLWVKEATK
jgi:hypothetical protein